MPKPSPSPDGDAVPEREAFAARARAAGLSLSAREEDAVFAIASWLRDGLAALPLEEGALPPEHPADLGIAEAGRRLRLGTLSAEALAEATLARIGERDGDYRAFYRVTGEAALAAARQADAELAAGLDRGPLHGIPVGIKDMIDVAGLPTTAGSRLLEEHVAAADALVVTRLRDAGAILVGKLATYEWGTVGPAYDTLYPPARNPWNLAHITGGSSSGSAVAVAGGLVRTTLGSDTGGSVRGPASYCGVVGLKPTFRLVPGDGVLGMSPSMDHVGPMSATVAEAAITLDVIAGLRGESSAARWLGQPIAGLRIGYARSWFAGDAQAAPAAVEALDRAAALFRSLGAIVEPVELPDYHRIEVAAAAVLHAECYRGHAVSLAEHPDKFGRSTYGSLAAGVALGEAEYARAKAAGARFRETLDRGVFRRCDTLLTITALTPAPAVSLFEKGPVWTPMRTIGFNISGHPALSLPAGLADGLPLGMQLVGPHFGEARLCQIGDAFERATADMPRLPPPLR